MGHTSDPRFLVLHGLRLKGFAEASGVAVTTGLDVAAVEEHLAKLAADELVEHHDGGPLVGWALTREGRAEQQGLAIDDLAASGATDAVRLAYERFLALNMGLLAVCTDWQVRGSVPNDHSDDAYDAAVIGRLREIHTEALPIVDDLGQVLDRFAGYAPRLTAALDRLAAGEQEYFTKPIIDSYHTIWFELHEDLLTSLGLERSEEGTP